MVEHRLALIEGINGVVIVESWIRLYLTLVSTHYWFLGWYQKPLLIPPLSFSPLSLHILMHMYMCEWIQIWSSSQEVWFMMMWFQFQFHCTALQQTNYTVTSDLSKACEWSWVDEHCVEAHTYNSRDDLSYMQILLRIHVPLKYSAIYTLIQ